MNGLSSFLLGLVQGFTEFLPVSSSGHLVLAKAVFGLGEPDIAFDTALHFGTLLAVLAFFRRDIAALFVSFCRSFKCRDGGEKDLRVRQEARQVWLILLATVPAGLVGVLFRDAVEGVFESPIAAAAMLLVTGSLLWLGGRRALRPSTLAEVAPAAALAIGIAQAFALLPGISRSGATISAGLLLGLDGRSAPRFSFLLAVPAILGATLLQVKELGQLSRMAPLPLLIGVATAAVSGYLAIMLVFKALEGRRFHLFAVYCWIVGLSTVIYLWR